MEVHFLSPFLRQCFVTSGVSLNMAGVATVMAFTAGMLPQLKHPDSGFQVDDSLGSWIAAMPCICLLLGNLMISPIMGRFGRRPANIISLIISLISWLGLALAKNIPAILLARFLHGIYIGTIFNVGPILIGEYTSPQNRGAFLMSISVLTSIFVLIVHAVGSHFGWQLNAVVCMIITFVNLVIVIYSPESPVWLADKGRFDDCRRVFRWLRGDDEDEELNKIIKASMITHKKETDKPRLKPLDEFKKQCKTLIITIKEPAFFKPILIMIHIYALSQWGGINVLSTYPEEALVAVVGEIDMANQIIYLDLQRIASNTAALFVIRRVKRRTMLVSMSILCIVTFLTTSLYTYTKSKMGLPYDHPFIGLFLVHVLMFSVAFGTISLPFIIAGEIFPLEYKGLAGGISVAFYAFNFGVVVKTLPSLFSTIGVYGAFVLYAAVVGYSLVVSWWFLPETKDRTLQDIEDEFRGKSLLDDVKSVHTLLSKAEDLVLLQ